jgi:hypothetical protein
MWFQCICMQTSERAGARVGARRRFAGTVAAARRLRCGARRPRASAELALPSLGAQTAALDAAARRNPRSAPLLTVPEARRHSPTRDPAGSCVGTLAGGLLCSHKAGADACSGACVAPSIAAQWGKSTVRGGPARKIYALARSAPMRSHRSRPAERDAQGTRSAAKGATPKPMRASAPALPRRHATTRPDNERQSTQQ